MLSKNLDKNTATVIIAVLYFTLFLTSINSFCKEKVIIKVLEKGLVYVEGGAFVMGCNDENDGECFEDEKPTHQVKIDSYLISKYEITISQYVEFLNDISYPASGTISDTQHGSVSYVTLNSEKCPIHFDGEKYGLKPQISDYSSNSPMVMVSWYGANAYCKWAGGRLPTEAEWEFSARGGQKGKQTRYSGSNDIDKVGWYGKNSNKIIQEVGKKAPNELGLYDMSGNVWEWCSDIYGPYTKDKITNPKGMKKGELRVFKGGGYKNQERGCRVAERADCPPIYAAIEIGFRMAKSINNN